MSFWIDSVTDTATGRTGVASFFPHPEKKIKREEEKTKRRICEDLFTFSIGNLLSPQHGLQCAKDL
jgi:hypothetical protein